MKAYNDPLRSSDELNPFSAGTVFIRQILTYMYKYCRRAERIKPL